MCRKAPFTGLILISSHILGELSKIATHCGIMRGGTLIREMRESKMSKACRDFVFVKTSDNMRVTTALSKKYRELEQKDDGIRLYDEAVNAKIRFRFPVLSIQMIFYGGRFCYFCG